MPKRNIQGEIKELPLEEVLTRIEANQRTLAERWRKGWTYGGAVRQTSILEHTQVLLYDRLMDLTLGAGWVENIELVRHIMQYARGRADEFKKLYNKVR